MSIDCYSRVEAGDEIPDDPHAYHEFLQDRLCSKAGRARICGSRVFVDVARSQSPVKHILLERPDSQGVHSVFEATALLSIVFDILFSIMMT